MLSEITEAKIPDPQMRCVVFATHRVHRVSLSRKKKRPSLGFAAPRKFLSTDFTGISKNPGAVVVFAGLRRPEMVRSLHKQRQTFFHREAKKTLTGKALDSSFPGILL